MKRGDVCLVHLDPATGAETGKVRPCVIVSPDEANIVLATVIIAPMTTKTRGWPSRVPARFQGKSGEVALDQLRAIDKTRVLKRLGKLDASSTERVLERLIEMFTP